MQTIILQARHLVAAASFAAAAALLAALLVAVAATGANDYLALGFHHTVAYLLADRLAAFLPPAAGLAALASLVFISSPEHRVRSMLDAAPPLLAAAAAGGSVILFAVRFNLNRFAKQWERTTELLGLTVPQALVKWYVMATDLGFLLAALLIGWAVYLLARRAVRGLGFSGHRAWRRLGSPAAALPLVALVAVIPITARGLRSVGQPAPNFILVSLDSLRADRLGCYGYDRDTSPHLDRLAAESYLFERAFSQAPRTDLSHMSLFTGLYPSVHGVIAPRALPGPRLTLAERLREAGFRTAAFTDGGYLRRGLGFAQGFERYDDLGIEGFAANMGKFLDWHDGLRRGSRFFAFLHTYDVHFPYDAPLPWRERFVDPGYDGPFARDIWHWKALGKPGSVVSEPTAEDLAYVEARYDGGVSAVDALVGELLAELQRRGLLETTWIVLTSDHGEAFLEHGRIFHDSVYHTVSHVPLIVRPAGGSSTAKRIPQVVELIDVAPTLVELAGLEPTPGADGRSLLPLLRGRQRGWPNLAISEAPFREYWHRGLTTATLHLVVASEAGEIEVYDYLDDPLEQRPLAEVGRQAELSAALDHLQEWSRRVGGPALRTRPPPAHDPETERQLRALGYLD